MKYGKVTIAITLVAIMGLGLFVGLVSAPGIPDQFQQILTALLGIQSDVEKTTQMLGSFSGDFASSGEGPSGPGGGVEVTSSKPVIFTVTMHVNLQVGEFDKVWVAHAPNKWMWATGFGPVQGNDVDKTFTIAGYGVSIVYYNFGPGDLQVYYSIVVQGEKGTEVKIGEWT